MDNSIMEIIEILRVKNIKKHYGRQEVLKGIDFSVRRGQFIGIFGVNGSGKSTLLSILAGVNKPSEGQVYAYGVNLLENKSYVRECIGYVPQDNPLIEDLSVRDNLKLWYCDSPLDMKKEMKSGFMKLLGIDAYQKKLVKKLSGGMKKRVSVAIALHNRPGILLLDEPSAALDVIAKKNIRDYLKRYVSEGGSVILVTHEEEELELCDTVYILKDGTLIESSADAIKRGEQVL